MSATCTHYAGHAAIAYAKAHGLLLSRYRDATGPARDGLTVEQAEEIAQRDPILIYLSVVSSSPAHGAECQKAPHTGSGYLHAADDDGPYNVDGAAYCGRCHHCLP